MKYAGGCFGCLTLILFVTAMVFTFAAGTILAMVTQADPDAGQALAPLIAYFGYFNDGCCCLSGVLAVVFLAMGMSKKDDGSGE